VNLPFSFRPKIVDALKQYSAQNFYADFTAGMTVGYPHAPVRPSAPMTAATAPQSEPDMSFHPNTRVAVGVEPDRFFKLLMSRLTS